MFRFNCDPDCNAKTSAPWWSYFVEGFDKQNRIPSIACKVCAHVFQHPRAGVEKGAPTTTMKKHILTKCPRITRSSGSKHGVLDKLLSDARKDITQDALEEQIL